MRPVSLFQLLIRLFISTINGMNADGRNYKWTGKVAAVLCVVLLYVGSYCALRRHFTGNLITREGYFAVIQPPQSIKERVGNKNSIFGPTFPLLPMELNKAINNLFYPARRVDLATTNRQLLLRVEFPYTPLHPNFFPTR